MALADNRELEAQIVKLTESLGADVPIDEAIREAVPEGTKIMDAHRYGESAWAFTAKISAIDKNGEPSPFFLKMVPGELGRQQLPGEFAGMSALYEAAPNLVPKPIAWGKCKNMTTPTHFLLVSFKQFTPGLPDPVKLGKRVAAMHKNSESPTGMFGFTVQTFDGARIQIVDWDPSWASFFSKMLGEAYRQDCEVNGVWPELDAVFKRVKSHLIPRLLGALESDGRSIKPTLIHGDMWEGNTGTDSNGDPWIFDCAAYYGHNEMELGIWRAERHQLRAKVYSREYRRHFEPSEPEEEWDDRVRLYSAKTNFMFSACFPGSPSRQCILDDFSFLLEKYQDEMEEVRVVDSTGSKKKSEDMPSVVHIEV